MFFYFQTLKSEQSDSENENNMYSDDDIPSDIDMNDPYFAEEFKDRKKPPKKRKGKEHQDNNQTEEDQKSKVQIPEKNKKC